MFICYICKARKSSVSVLRSHMNGHAAIGALPVPLKCCQNVQNCRGTFTTVYNLIRHLTHYHGADDECDNDNSLDSSECLISGDTSILVSDNDNSSHPVSHSDDLLSADTTDWLHEIKVEGASLVAGLRAKGYIPNSAICEVVQACNSMSSILIAGIAV